jgi:hypothetical protein
MLRFFRIIRQNLLMEKNNAKYFKYAIGEILLVVIGILIAVSINNWNDYRVDQSLEKSYLNSIITDIDENTSRMQEVIEMSNALVESGNFLLTHFKNPTKKQDAVLMTHVGNLIPINHFQSRDIAFEDLKSSGRLNLISNNDVKLKIQEYYNHNERVSSVINMNGQYKYKEFNEFIINTDIDLNSIMSSLSQSFANADGIVEIDAFQTDFFYKPINEPIIKELIIRISSAIIFSQLNLNRSNIGIEMGEDLKMDIYKYLND